MFTYDLYNLHVTVLVFQKEISSYDLLLAITLLVIVKSMNYEINILLRKLIINKLKL